MSRANDENTAWQLVIAAGEEQRPVPHYSISRSTSLPHDKVLAMAGRYHLMKRAGIEPTGNWWHDRVNVKLPTTAIITPISNSTAA